MVENSIKQKAKRGMYWNTFSNVANQGVQFVIGIILARLLSPADYGIIALPTIFLLIAQCFIDSGFSSALVRKDEVTDEDLSTAFFFNIGVGVFFYLLLFVLSPFVAEFYHTPILSDVLRLTALGLLFGPLQSVHFALFSRSLDFKTPSLVSVSSKLTTGIVGIVMAFMGFGIWSLVFQGIAGSLLSLGMVWTFSKWRPKLVWSNESFKYLWGFGSKLLSSSILDTIYNNIVPVFLGKFGNTKELGIYNRGYGYAVLPYNQLNGMIAPLTFPLFSRLQSDEEKLYDYFRRILRLILFVLAPIELLLAALAKPLIILLITDKWSDCIIVMQLMCVAIVLWPVQGLNISLMSAKGRSDLVFKTNLGVKLLGLCTVLGSLPFGIVALCATSILRSVICITWVAYYAGKFSKFGALKQWKEMAPILLLASTMSIVVYLFVGYIDSNVLKLLAGIIVGGSFYVGAAYILKFSELREALSLLHLKK